VWPPSTSVELSSQLPPLPERWIDPVLSRIAPIESTNLHLVAITASFASRLYFSTLNRRTFNEATPPTRPVTLQLASSTRPTLPLNGPSKFIRSLSNSLFPAAQQLSETQNTGQRCRQTQQPLLDSWVTSEKLLTCFEHS
jgi:hypothetical protein